MFKNHEKDYEKDAWLRYSLQELGSFVHLFAKRAEHRKDIKKKEKDLQDASNYLEMMRNKLKAMGAPDPEEYS